MAAGPKDTAPITVQQATSDAVCGGRPISGAPKNAAVTWTGDAPKAGPVKPPAIPAEVIAAAANQLDTLLPKEDVYTPRDPDAAPSRQEGVEVGSVVKIRRFGAPPVHLVSGVRACTGVLALVDAGATAITSHVIIPGACGIGRALPPVDLDNDGTLESAFFSEDTVVLSRLTLSPSAATLETVGSWSCPAGGEK